VRTKYAGIEALSSGGIPSVTFGLYVEWVFRNAWILLVAMTCANAGVWWHRGKKEIVNHPELEERIEPAARG
jgi:hypothetical protein